MKGLRQEKLVISSSDEAYFVTIREKLQLLNVKELKIFASKLGLQAKGRKEVIINSILACKATCLGIAKEAELHELLGECVAIPSEAILVMRHVEFLYFLNRQQGTERFFLSSQGRTCYPQYHVNCPIPVFSNRKELEDFQQGLKAEEDLEIAQEAGNNALIEDIVCKSCLLVGFKFKKLKDNIENACPASLPHNFSVEKENNEVPNIFQCFRAGWMHVRVAHHGIGLLERAKRYLDAIDLIQILLGRSEYPSKRGDWWNRFSIDLEHLGKIQSSLEIAETGLADEWVRGGARLSLQRRVLRLGRPPRRWKKPPFADRALWRPRERKVIGRPINRKRSVKSIFVGFNDDNVTVEELAIQYYSQSEHGSWKGIHCEGGIWNTLFGILMWDILFSDLPNVFQHPFQTCPLDFDTDFFYHNRKESILMRIEELRRGDAPKIIHSVWEREAGRKTFCCGVFWDRYTEDELLTAADCVGGQGLAVIMKQLAQDHKHWRSGMPDLFLWKISPKPQARLVEVKGPRDNLADHQRAWLAELSSGGVDVEICRVVEP